MHVCSGTSAILEENNQCISFILNFYRTNAWLVRATFEIKTVEMLEACAGITAVKSAFGLLGRSTTINTALTVNDSVERISSGIKSRLCHVLPQQVIELFLLTWALPCFRSSVQLRQLTNLHKWSSTTELHAQPGNLQNLHVNIWSCCIFSRWNERAVENPCLLNSLLTATVLPSRF